MKQTIQAILAEAEILAESPRSVRIYNNLTAKKGEPLTFYDIFDYTNAVETSILPSEILKDMALDVKGVIDRVKELYCVDIKPDMSVLEIAQML